MEGRDFAPFGRGDVVRVWDTPHGPAVMIDPDYPLAEPLIRLLLKMERIWPVGRHVPKRPAPQPPESREWVGDASAVLGGPIKTQILATIGVLGWTFEALCSEVLKYDRVTVKKGVMRRSPGLCVIVNASNQGYASKMSVVNKDKKPPCARNATAEEIDRKIRSAGDYLGAMIKHEAEAAAAAMGPGQNLEAHARACERFDRDNATLECELLVNRRFKTQREAALAVFDFIEGWYNPHRRHTSIGNISPVEFERRSQAA